MSEILLVEIAKKRLQHLDSQIVHFVGNSEIDAFLSDLNKYPHAYVLSCLMDRQIKAERAWRIPYIIKKELGSFELNDLLEVQQERYREIFNDLNLHRFNDTMSEIFYLGVKKIKEQYNGIASNIWLNKPSSAAVVYRFLNFKGCGVKIATMAANILARQFRIPFSDYYSIDISPDVHIIRVMKRMGFVPKDANSDMIIYKARELNPEFPGIIDFSCWEIGREWCRPKNPNCDECIVNKECKKQI